MESSMIARDLLKWPFLTRLFRSYIFLLQIQSISAGCSRNRFTISMHGQNSLVELTIRLYSVCRQEISETLWEDLSQVKWVFPISNLLLQQMKMMRYRNFYGVKYISQ